MLTLASSFTPGQSSLFLTEGQQVKDHILESLQASRLYVDCFWLNLDNRIFRDINIVNQIKSLCVKQPRIRFRFLIRNAKQISTRGTPLIHVFQRFTSNIQVKEVSRDYDEEIAHFITFDHNDYIYQPNYEVITCYYQQQNQYKSKLLTGFFEKAWEQGQSSAEFRPLHI